MTSTSVEILRWLTTRYLGRCIDKGVPVVLGSLCIWKTVSSIPAACTSVCSLVETLFIKWVNSGLFLFNFVLFKHHQTEMQDSNSSRWSIRRARWPLDHGYQMSRSYIFRGCTAQVMLKIHFLLIFNYVSVIMHPLENVIYQTNLYPLSTFIYY